MSETVAAVVVTYNRKQLLSECLDALLAQTRPVDKIILIDNASSDGTVEMLQDSGYLENSIIEHVRLSENTGGAGGFHEGMRRAVEAGHDWIWVMDDDGRPALDTLALLLETPAMQECRSRAPLVMDKESGKLSWGYSNGEKLIGFLPNIAKIQEVDQITTDVISDANFFLGNLFHRDIIVRVGLPIREMFIWGDEIEFHQRLIVNGVKSMTLCAARFYHPADPKNFVTVWRGVLGNKLIVSKLRLYCAYRNKAYTWRKYNLIGKLAFWYLRESLKYMVSVDFTGWLLINRAIIDGVAGRWGKERQYLLP